MAATRTFRLRALTPRRSSMSSRNALISGASTSSNATWVGGLCDRSWMNRKRSRNVSRYQLTVCGLA